jgi:death-on-curing protein
MISISQAEHIHSVLIFKFGGVQGIRDKNSLISALARPFQSFEGKDLYSTPLQKAAALIESILSNHPFVDGNKRTGYVLMRLLLINYKLDLKASQEEKFNFVIRIASGKFNFNDIVYWLENFTEPLNIS